MAKKNRKKKVHIVVVGYNGIIKYEDGTYFESDDRGEGICKTFLMEVPEDPNIQVLGIPAGEKVFSVEPVNVTDLATIAEPIEMVLFSEMSAFEKRLMKCALANGVNIGFEALLYVLKEPNNFEDWCATSQDVCGFAVGGGPVKPYSSEIGIPQSKVFSGRGDVEGVPVSEVLKEEKKITIGRGGTNYMVKPPSSLIDPSGYEDSSNGGEEHY